MLHLNLFTCARSSTEQTIVTRFAPRASGPMLTVFKAHMVLADEKGYTSVGDWPVRLKIMLLRKILGEVLVKNIHQALDFQTTSEFVL